MLGKGGFDEIELLQSLLVSRKHPGLMIDVGACYGGSLEWFAKHDWYIHAFEPDPANREILLGLTRRWPRVSVDPRAVADQCDQGVAFFSSDVSAGISGLSSFHPSHRESARVETTTLARYLEDQRISKVDFLKIDTEGFDLKVLQGVPWAEVMPGAIICEFEDRKTRPLGYDYHQLAQFIQKKGYDVVVSEWYPIEEYGTQHRWKRAARYPVELDDKDAWGNLVAARDPAITREFLRLADKR